MDNNELEKYPTFRSFGGIFWSENRVIFERKQGIFGIGVNFNFSVAALYWCILEAVMGHNFSKSLES